MKKKYKIVPYNGGYMPEEMAIREKKIQDLIDNPPIFDIKNKKEILKWVKTLFDLYKSKSQ